MLGKYQKLKEGLEKMLTVKVKVFSRGTRTGRVAPANPRNNISVLRRA